MKRNLLVLLFIINCVLAFSQDNIALWKEFFKAGIDGASNLIGKDKSAMPDALGSALQRIVVRNDPQHEYKLARVVSDNSGILSSLALQKIRITENFFITKDSIINKWELEITTNNVENELDMMAAIDDIMNEYAKKIEAPRVEEHWYGPPSVKGRFIWLWDSKKQIVTMIPSEGMWIWNHTALYLTITSHQ